MLTKNLEITYYDSADKLPADRAADFAKLLLAAELAHDNGQAPASFLDADGRMPEVMPAADNAGALTMMQVLARDLLE